MLKLSGETFKAKVIIIRKNRKGRFKGNFDTWVKMNRKKLQRECL
jgi:hypothetical protein